MTEHLEDLLRRLAAMPTDRSLAGFEVEVGQAIDRRRSGELTWAPSASVRLASILVALAIGATVGGELAASIAATHPQAGGLLAADTRLAPSNLLTGV